MKKVFFKLLVLNIICAIIVQGFSPVFALDNLGVIEPKQEFFAEKATEKQAQIDFENIDWGQEIILLDDLDEYFKTKEKLENEGKYDQVKNIQPVKQLMTEDKVLDYLKIPEEKKEIIKNLAAEDKFLPSPDVYTPLPPALQPKQVQLTKGIPYKQNIVVPKIKIQNLKLPEKPVKLPSKLPSKKSASVLPVAYADEPLANPLITIEAAFDQGLVPTGLYFLSEEQNPDGSFGKSNVYQTTASVLDVLTLLKKTDNDNYRLALSYLLSTEPKNNLEKAIKARILFSQNQPYQQLLDEVLSGQDPQTGGVGMKNYYQTDVVTSLEVAKSLYICNYSFDRALPPLLNYIVSQIDENGGVPYTEGSDPSPYLTNKTVQYLSFFKGYNLQGANGQVVSIRERIDTAAAFLVDGYAARELSDQLMLLKSLQMNSLHTDIQKILSEDLVGYQYFDGSFDGSVGSTVVALETLSQPDLIADQLVATTNLRNKDQAGFDLTVRNKGFKKADKGIINIFVDNFKITHQLNLADSGVTIQPGETKVIHIDFPDTATFIGDTKLEFYIENEGDLNFDDNWISRNFNFAASANGTPALPVYYIAYNRQISQYDDAGNFTGYTPGINVRWPKKDDPNRKYYLLMSREKNTNTWTYVSFSNQLNGGWWGRNLIAGKTYEVTVGAVHKDNKTFTYHDQFTEIKIGNDDEYTGTLNGVINENDKPAANVGYFAYDSSGRANSSGQISKQMPNGSNVFYVSDEQYEPLIARATFRPDVNTDNFRLTTHLKPDDQAPVVESFEIRWQEDHRINNQNEARLLAFGSDNIRLKDADFYYYDPNEGSWTYLGRQTVENYAAEFVWQVPEDLLGAGYKVKTIFYDYRGNASEPMEWGPFEIRDGTPPEFGMVSPNGGEVWELGSTNVIRWEVDSVNGVDEVDLDLIYPSGETAIRHNIPNTGSYSWQVPAEYTFVGDQVKVRVSGEDNGGGGEFFDDSNENLRIIDSSPSPALPWERPAVLTSNDNHALQNCTVGDFDIDYDAQGIAHVIYLCNKDSFAANGQRTVTDHIYHLQKNPDGWSAAQLVYQRSTPTDANLTGYRPIRRLKYLVDNNNQSHVIWQENILGCNENLQEIYYMNTVNGVWSQKQNVSVNNTYSFMPDFDVAGDGSVHAVWLDGQSYANCNTANPRSVFYKKRQNGQWINQPSIQGDARSDKPEIVIDSAGKPNLLYFAGIAGQLRHHKFENNQWSASTVVNNTYPYMVDLIRGGQPGELHYAFSQMGALGTKVMYQHFTGQQWEQIQQLSEELARHSYTDPQITSDNEGNLSVVFSDHNGQINKKGMIWASKTIGENWRILPSIILPSQEVGETLVTAAFGKQLAVIWPGYYSQSPEIFFNHADLTDWFVPQAPVEPPVDEPDPEEVALDPDFVNLVVDGAMEMDNMDNWVKWGTPLAYNKSDQEAFDGDRSVYIEVGPGSNAGVQQMYIPVEAGKSYRYSFRYKLISGTLHSDLAIYKNNSDYENKRIIKRVAGNEWKLVERQFTVPDDIGTKRFSAVIRVLSGSAYIDDVIIEPIEVNNLVVDGDMELDNMDNWVKWGTPLLYAKSADEAFAGSRSLHVQVGPVGSAGIQQMYIPVEAGKTYKYSFRYKLISGTLESDLCVYKNNSDYENKRIKRNIVSNDWQLVEREFTVPADLGTKRFSAVIRIRNGEGYIDDVVVEEL